MKKPRAKSPFEKARGIEESYARDLRKVAREVGRIVDAFDPNDPARLPPLLDSLRRYAEILTPWAEARADTMLAGIDRQDDRAWRNATAEMSRFLRAEIQAAPTGETFRVLRAEQVALITSLPVHAAQRVQNLAQQAFSGGQRSKTLIDEIMRTGEVTKARATTIARTEVARAASNFTEARAKHIGSEGYIWRTSRDADVRPSHKKMEGKYVAWNSAPTLDGLTGHAGCLPNCRCYPEPIIPARGT